MATNNPDLTTSDDLLAFHQFVSEKLKNGCQCSPEELLDEWRLEHPTPQELPESVAAVRLALADMEAGDQGRPAEEVIAELRRRFGVSRSS